MKNSRCAIKATGLAALTLLLVCILYTTVFAASLSVDKAVIQNGETVTATFGMAWAEYEGGFVGFYQKDAGDGSWITYKKIAFETTNLTIPDPYFAVKVEDPGSYEFRMFTDYWGSKKVATVSVECVFSPTSSITVKNANVVGGDKITADYSISKIDGENTAGWIGLYLAGTEDDKYLTYKKTGGVSGTFEVDAPATAGTYNFRLFKDYYGVYKLATSGTVTVTAKDEREVSKARFNSITGEVSYSPDPATIDWQPVTPNTILHVGDHISTGADSSCILQFEDMTTFTMKPETEVIIKKSLLQETKLGLVAGHMWTNFKKMLTNGTMEVEMGQAVAGIKGTTFVCEQIGGKSTLKVMEGVVEFTSKVNQSKIIIGTGEMVTADSTGLGKKQKFDLAAESADWGKTALEAAPNNEKVIVLQIGNPYMVVDTIRKEIDPGKGTTPLILNGRTILPIRAVIEALGGTVDWIGAEQKVTVTLKDKKVELWIGNKTIRVNGVSKTMDVVPQIIKGRTMLPVRFVAENLGAGVQWDGTTQEAYINYIP